VLACERPFIFSQLVIYEASMTSRAGREALASEHATPDPQVHNYDARDHNSAITTAIAFVLQVLTKSHFQLRTNGFRPIDVVELATWLVGALVSMCTEVVTVSNGCNKYPV